MEAFGLPTNKCTSTTLKLSPGEAPIIEATYKLGNLPTEEITKRFKVEEISNENPKPFILFFGRQSAINSYIEENNLHQTPHIHIKNTQSVKSYAGPLINIVFLDGWAETADLGDTLNLIVHRQKRYTNPSITIDFR